MTPRRPYRRMRAILEAGRRGLRAVRHMPDRLLHPLRRRVALARLRRAPAPGTVLVLCYGNICRSPFAAERLRVLLGASPDSIRVASAGFHKFGRPPPDEALAVASERGVQMADHRSRLVDDEMLAESDLVLVVAPAHARMLRREFGHRKGVLLLGDLDPHPIRIRTIPDPLDQSRDVFREVYDRIDRCLDAFVNALNPAPFYRAPGPMAERRLLLISPHFPRVRRRARFAGRSSPDMPASGGGASTS
jgi:protein-tyrosine-phosphatase